jgi:hypothetical protein
MGTAMKLFVGEDYHMQYVVHAPDADKAWDALVLGLPISDLETLAVLDSLYQGLKEVEAIPPSPKGHMEIVWQPPEYTKYQTWPGKDAQ